MSLSRLGCAVFGVLFAAAASNTLAAPVELPDVANVSAVMRNCLLPTPPGYAASSQQPLRQQMPFPLDTEQRARLLFPQHPELAGRTMGWTLPDRDYTERTPLEAKVVPRDLSALPVLRFNNLEIQGERELRWRAHGEYDQWFLHDVTRKLNALMAIHRRSKRAYFFEYRWKSGRVIYDQSTESCYSCHASGPRLIGTYDLEKVDTKRLGEFNRRLLSYGAAASGESVDQDRLGPPLADERCTACHDGTVRGRLYAMHLPTVAYYLQSLRVMPPGAPLPPEAVRSLISGQYQRFLTDKGPRPLESTTCPEF